MASQRVQGLYGRGTLQVERVSTTAADMALHTFNTRSVSTLDLVQWMTLTKLLLCSSWPSTVAKSMSRFFLQVAAICLKGLYADPPEHSPGQKRSWVVL